MIFGKPTGGADAADVGACRVHQAGPLGADGQVFDLLPEVANRYSGRRRGPRR